MRRLRHPNIVQAWGLPVQQSSTSSCNCSPLTRVLPPLPLLPPAVHGNLRDGDQGLSSDGVHDWRRPGQWCVRAGATAEPAATAELPELV